MRNRPRNKLLEDATNELSTDFLDGLQFRAFGEFDLSNGEELVFKIVAPNDFYLDSIVLNLNSGSIEYMSKLGGVEGGVFTPLETIFPLNGRNDVPAYTRLIQVSAGGTVTGGIVFDMISVKTGTNNQRISITEEAGSKRGIAAGTYYLVVKATANTSGILYSNWTER